VYRCIARNAFQPTIVRRVADVSVGLRAVELVRDEIILDRHLFN
jgi:hypothetical protein